MKLVITLAAGLVSIAVCSIASSQDKPKPDAKTQKVELASDLVAQAPADWKSQKPERQFRTHEFVLPSKEKGLDDGFLFITHFGKGGGGELDANITRWFGMVEQPDGGSTEKASKKSEVKSDGAKSTWLDIPGTYLDRPAPGSPEVTKRPKYRVFAAMIDGGKDGPYWLRAYGPDAVMVAHREGFEQFLKSISKK